MDVTNANTEGVYTMVSDSKAFLSYDNFADLYDWLRVCELIQIKTCAF